MFLKLRNSIFEICLHLINSYCTLYFLPSVMLSSGAGTSKEIPLPESGLALPAILITLPFLLLKSVIHLIKFIQSCLIKCPPIFRWLRVIPTCSLWNKSQTDLVHSGTTRQISSIQLKYPKPTRHGCPQSRRSHPQNPEF